mgnify:CR=1 FL=1
MYEADIGVDEVEESTQAQSVATSNMPIAREEEKINPVEDAPA